MIVLDSAVRYLQIALASVVANNQLPFTVSYVDGTTTSYVPGANDGATNSLVPVTLLPPPAAGVQRQLKSLSVVNVDTAAAKVTISFNDGGTVRSQIIVTLDVGDNLFYEDGNGFKVITAAGAAKTNATGGGGSTGVASVNTRTGGVTLLGTDIPAFGPSGTQHAQGAVPDPGATAGTTRYLREDGTWQIVSSGSGGITSISGDGTAGSNGVLTVTKINGVTPGAANGVATLDGSAKLPTSQLPASIVGAVVYQGTWNASTNTPTLVSSSGVQGNYYKVSVAGTTNLNGIASWNIGDTVIFDGTTWDKIDGVTNEFLSLNGLNGAVVLAAGFGIALTPSGNTITISASGGSAIPSVTGRIGNALRAGVSGAVWGAPAQPFKFVGRNNPYSIGGNASTATDIGGTTRVPYIAKGNITTLKALMSNIGSNGSGVEYASSPATPIIKRIAVEFGGFVNRFTVAGNTTFTLDSATQDFIETDALGVCIPDGSTFWIREYTRVPTPPTAPAAALATGVAGFLTVGTTYFYKITAMDTGLESGPTTEVSATPTSGNTAINLSWTANPFAQRYRIYRSTATGTEVLIAEVAAPATGWQDIGAGAVVSATTPPAAPTYRYARNLGVGESSNYVFATGNGADATGTTGALSIVGPIASQSVGNFALTGNAANINSIVGLGDSIMQGTGIVDAAALTNHSARVSNWFDQGISLTSGNFNTVNIAIAGSSMVQFTNNSRTNQRAALLNYGDTVIDQLGTNDLSAAATWQTLAGNKLLSAQYAKAKGQRYFLTTLTPHTLSTDNWFTAVNQSAYVAVSGFEAARQNFNTWVRNGSQVDGGGAPVLTGGTASPYIDGYFDLAAPVEVNSSNVLTPNGGFWLANQAAAFTGVILTGTPTLITLPCSAQAFTAGALTSYLVKMTSGAANGQIAIINTNGTNTIQVYGNGSNSQTNLATYVGLTTTPAAGDTFSIYPIITQDGLHPDWFGHNLIAAAFATWAATNFAAY